VFRSRRKWWLSLVIVVASLVGGLAWWSAAQPPGLHLRAVLSEHTESNDGPLEVTGFSPDGSLLVAASRRMSCDAIVVWDVPTGKVRKVIEPEKGNGNAGHDEDAKTSLLDFGLDRRDLHFLGFSPDSRMMAVGDDKEGIKIWDTTVWQVRSEIKVENADECRFFSDGKTLLIRSGPEPQIWDLPTGKRVASLESESIVTEGIETWIAPDEKTVLVVVNEVDEDGYKWWVDTWDSATWRKRQSIQWTDPTTCERGISPDGRLVAGIGGGSLKIWDVATGRKLCELKVRKAGAPEQEMMGCGWGQGGERYIVCFANGSMVLCDIKQRQTTTVEEWVWGPYVPPCYSWSSDGRTLAVLTHKLVPKNMWILGLPATLQRRAVSFFGAPGNTHWCSVGVHDLGAERVQRGRWEPAYYESVVFSPDGSILAVGDHWAKVHLFDVPKAPPPPE
jgi:WD40 repeat protein